MQVQTQFEKNSVAFVREREKKEKKSFSVTVINSEVKAGVLNHSRKDVLRKQIPLLSDAELLMSPVIKEDSDCFLTVSFHIRRMRLCGEK